jgi:hypothetical protein
MTENNCEWNEWRPTLFRIRESTCKESNTTVEHHGWIAGGFRIVYNSEGKDSLHGSKREHEKNIRDFLK